MTIKMSSERNDPSSTPEFEELPTAWNRTAELSQPDPGNTALDGLPDTSADVLKQHPRGRNTAWVWRVLNGVGLNLEALKPLDPNQRRREYFRAISFLTNDQFDDHLMRAQRSVHGHLFTILHMLDQEIRQTCFPEKPSNAITILEILKRRSQLDGLGLDPVTVAGRLFAELCRLANLPIEAKVAHPFTKTDVAKMVEDDRIIKKHGTRYLPISLAASLAQVPRTTLSTWIRAKVKFQGRALQTYDSRTTRRSYLAEESVQRVANRFVKWPSKQPAGALRIGETKDKSGYVGIAKAARTIGIDHHTLWLWITQGNAPTENPLDVVKCAASDQFYMSEKSIADVTKVVPRSGLQRGRRSRMTTQP
jgi:hypothetical protein